MSEAVERVVAALQVRGLQPEIHLFDASTRTAEEAAAAIGTEVPRIVKSLVLLADGQPILALVSGANRVDLDKLGASLGKRVARADAERVQRETSFTVGGIPPVGHRSPLPTFVDADLLQFDQVWAAAGSPHAVFPIDPRKLVEVTGGRVINLKAEGS